VYAVEIYDIMHIQAEKSEE